MVDALSFVVQLGDALGVEALHAREEEEEGEGQQKGADEEQWGWWRRLELDKHDVAHNARAQREDDKLVIVKVLLALDPEDNCHQHATQEAHVADPQRIRISNGASEKGNGERKWQGLVNKTWTRAFFVCIRVCACVRVFFLSLWSFTDSINWNSAVAMAKHWL
jgi:hypothetical protein